MTADELRSLLADLLAGAAGGKAERWRKLIGEVTVYPVTLRPACNWTVEPSGKAAERDAIERAVEVVRGEHPYVRFVA